MSVPQNPKEISRQTIGRGRYLALDNITWQDAKNATRQWEAVDRVEGNHAVLIIAWLRPSDRLLLVRQPRPPAKCTVIEFPAGLIDADEPPAEAALRELHEETGYRGRLIRLLPPAFNTPGLSSEAVHVALVSVDETLTENQHPEPRPDDGEDLEILAIRRCELCCFTAEAFAQGACFDSKVIAYLAALGVLEA